MSDNDDRDCDRDCDARRSQGGMGWPDGVAGGAMNTASSGFGFMSNAYAAYTTANSAASAAYNAFMGANDAPNDTLSSQSYAWYTDNPISRSIDVTHVYTIYGMYSGSVNFHDVSKEHVARVPAAKWSQEDRRRMNAVMELLPFEIVGTRHRALNRVFSARGDHVYVSLPEFLELHKLKQRYASDRRSQEAAFDRARSDDNFAKLRLNEGFFGLLLRSAQINQFAKPVRMCADSDAHVKSIEAAAFVPKSTNALKTALAGEEAIALLPKYDKLVRGAFRYLQHPDHLIDTFNDVFSWSRSEFAERRFRTIWSVSELAGEPVVEEWVRNARYVLAGIYNALLYSEQLALSSLTSMRVFKRYVESGRDLEAFKKDVRDAIVGSTLYRTLRLITQHRKHLEDKLDLPYMNKGDAGWFRARNGGSSDDRTCQILEMVRMLNETELHLVNFEIYDGSTLYTDLMRVLFFCVGVAITTFLNVRHLVPRTWAMVDRYTGESVLTRDMALIEYIRMQLHQIKSTYRHTRSPGLRWLVTCISSNPYNQIRTFPVLDDLARRIDKMVYTVNNLADREQQREELRILSERLCHSTYAAEIDRLFGPAGPDGLFETWSNLYRMYASGVLANMFFSIRNFVGVKKLTTKIRYIGTLNVDRPMSRDDLFAVPPPLIVDYPHWNMFVDNGRKAIARDIDGQKRALDEFLAKLKDILAKTVRLSMKNYPKFQRGDFSNEYADQKCDLFQLFGIDANTSPDVFVAESAVERYLANRRSGAGGSDVGGARNLVVASLVDDDTMNLPSNAPINAKTTAWCTPFDVFCDVVNVTQEMCDTLAAAEHKRYFVERLARAEHERTSSLLFHTSDNEYDNTLLIFPAGEKLRKLVTSAAFSALLDHCSDATSAERTTFAKQLMYYMLTKNIVTYPQRPALRAQSVQRDHLESSIFARHVDTMFGPIDSIFIY